MSQLGQERRIGAVRNISALSPRADVGADIVEPPNRFAAQSGHVAGRTMQPIGRLSGGPQNNSGLSKLSETGSIIGAQSIDFGLCKF
jgi:hypothetical protein